MSVPLPVYLITGFLGSGKTTFLRRLAETRKDRHMLFLVNELAGQDVDAGRLRETGLATVSVVGGSIFCECKAADFLRMLREDVMPLHLRQPLDALVIETSGIADPGAIGTLIDKAGYGDRLQVRAIVALLAPQHFRTLFEKLPVLEAQLRAADTVVLNKCDLATRAQIDDCRAGVQGLNPRARLLETSFCQDLPDMDPPRLSPLPNAPFGKCGGVKFRAETLAPPEFEDEAAFRAWCGDALRVKGLAHIGGHLRQADLSPDGLILLPQPSGNPSLVRITSTSPSAPPAPHGLIACDVFREELESLTLPLPLIRWLEMGLHDRPDELRRRLQEEIDAADKEPGDEPVLLLYGLCGGGLYGLQARRRPLILPRTHDCIALLLGSKQKQQDIQKKCPGTYFYSRGWIRERRVPGPDRAEWLRNLYADRFDPEMIEELIEADAETFEPYEQALFIRTPAAEAGESYCQRCAAHLGWRFVAEQADMRWLRDLLSGIHDDERFVILAPGQTLTASGDNRIFS